MDDRLLKKYLVYANSEEAFAVLFVKKHLIQAKGHWVDIVDCRRYRESTDKLHFQFIIGGLYKRKIHPKYPSKSEYTINGRFDERKYYLMTRAITWETAHTDIEQQKQNNVVASKFDISGIYFDKNLGSTGYFVDSAPLEIKALENNLLDYTNPLWDIAERYRNKPDFVYKVERVDIIRHDS
jgi:hypothetical protein